MRLLPALVLLTLAGCASTAPGLAPSVSSAATEARLDGAALAADVRVLAADELQGRRAGTVYADVAARYIAERLREAGALPVPGAEDGFFQTVPLRDGTTSKNVMAVVRGSDPTLADEYVVLTAHYDHLGAGATRRGASAADSVFNGARDNAMGVAAVIGAARAFAEAPPKRSVLFLLVTAEEIGLVGSRYYAENPLVPLRQTVFALNIDGAGYSDTTRVTVIGLDRTTAQPLIARGAADAGLSAALDPSPEQNLFDRSDNVAFAAKGIPAPTVSPGFQSFSDPGVADFYHKVTDEAGSLDFAYLTRFAQAYVGAARLIADAAERPRWNAGDKYEEAARARYGN